jgi:glycogen synthase
MKVLIVADVVGGVRTFARELVAELAARGTEVHLALIGSGAGSGETSQRLEFPGAASCEIRDLKLEWMEHPWADVAHTAAWIEERRRSLRPELIHMNTFAPVLDSQVPVLLTVHSCVFTWWRAVHGTDPPPSWRAYRLLVEKALARADAIAVPSRGLLRQLEEVYGPLQRAEVIPNGRAVEADWRQLSRERERLVVSAGRLWDQAKNAGLVAAAAPRLEADVALIGSGSGDRGDDPAVHALPELDEPGLLGWLRRAAVFAEPARYEPFGLTALEAGLCGCALVLGDIPSLREIWPAAADFVSPDDEDGLVHAINRLLRNPDARVRAARRAYLTARRRAPALMADRYLDSYSATASRAVPV